MVKLRLFTILRRIVGTEYIEFDSSSVSIRELLEELVIRYPEVRMYLPRKDDPLSLIDFYFITVEGKSIDMLDGLETIVKHDDTITILPPIAGG